jgi:hypothetical protein
MAFIRLPVLLFGDRDTWSGRAALPRSEAGALPFTGPFSKTMSGFQTSCARRAPDRGSVVRRSLGGGAAFV